MHKLMLNKRELKNFSTLEFVRTNHVEFVSLDSKKKYCI